MMAPCQHPCSGPCVSIERPTVVGGVGMLRTLGAHAVQSLDRQHFGLSAAHIEPRFASEKHAAVTESILVLRNRVAHGGGLSTAHAADLLQTHESGFFALLRAVVATTAGVQIHGYPDSGWEHWLGCNPPWRLMPNPPCQAVCTWFEESARFPCSLL